jgi:chaperonin GroES
MHAEKPPCNTEWGLFILDKSITGLQENIDKINIADQLDETKLAEIGRKVCFGYNIDEDSRKDWWKLTQEGLKIARQVSEKKSYPWAGAANIKYPLIATAAIQFAARAYPQIIQGTDVVKAQMVGKPTLDKEARAKRVGMHMSYQLLEQMEEWESDTDQLLTALPVVGMYFRKTYYDTLLRRNRSIGISPENLVVNQKITDLKTARRITEKINLYKNEVIERERAGIYVEKINESMQQNDEEDKAELFLEQHRWLDLDDDGYEEPYIVTVHEESQKVCRIVASYDLDGFEEENGKVKKITPVDYYTDFGFLPDPAGNYYKMGFAHLLGPINETINVTINQLLDSGHLANCQSGFIGSGVRLKGGVLRVKPNEWIPIDVPGSILKDNIFPLPVRDPSPVLFQLLGLLTETGMKLAAVSETMTGETPGQNTPATTVLAMIEQGLKVFTSIYKRVFRSLKLEYKKLYRLNRLYMDDTEYIRVLDDQMAVFQSDYAANDLDIVPVADPTISSEAQRLARAQAMLNSLQYNPTKGGKIGILRYYYEAIGVPDVEQFLPPKEVEQLVNSQEPPNPDLIKIQNEIINNKAKLEIESRKANMAQVEMEVKIEYLLAQIKEINTRAIKNIAEAEAKEAGIQIDSYAAMANAQASEKANELRAKAGKEKENGDTGTTQQGGVQPVEAEPGNGEGLPTPDGTAGGLPESVDPGANIEQSLSGSNGDADYNAIGADLRAEQNT